MCIKSFTKIFQPPPNFVGILPVDEYTLLVYSKIVIKLVVITNKAKKQITKLPVFIVTKLLSWVEDVEVRGLEMVRKIPGYHDEPLKGDRKGQRSIRLNRSYRAIYIINDDGLVEFIEVIEVNKHEY